MCVLQQDELECVGVLQKRSKIVCARFFLFSNWIVLKDTNISCSSGHAGRNFLILLMMLFQQSFTLNSKYFAGRINYIPCWRIYSSLSNGYIFSRDTAVGTLVMSTLEKRQNKNDNDLIYSQCPAVRVFPMPPAVDVGQFYHSDHCDRH